MTKEHPDLSQLALRLVKTSGLLLDDNAELDAFYGALDEVLELEDPDDEVAVLHSAADALHNIVPERAPLVLEEMLQEFEVESEYLPSLDAAGVEHASLLFAIPFVVKKGLDSSLRFVSPEGPAELERILAEAQIISDVAEFRLVPRVFSLAELQGRAFSEVHRLVQHWSAQLADEGELGSAGPGFLATPSFVQPLLPKANNPFVELHFLLGVLRVKKSDLPDVFPAPILFERDDDETDGSPSEGQFVESDPFAEDTEVGFTEDNVPWDDAFAEELANGLGLMSLPLAMTMPNGFHEDVAAGLELEREVGLQVQFSFALEDQGIAEGGAHVGHSAIVESAIVRGWVVTLHTAAHEPLEEVVWPVLAHESPEQCCRALVMALHPLGLHFNEELNGTLPGQVTLH